MERIVRTPDGRTLAVEDGGDPAGRPVLGHAGTPSSSRYQYGPALADAAGHGLRLISYDRPGSGGSTALLSLAIGRSHRAASIIGVVVAVVGLAGTFLSTAGQYAGSSLYLGLGVGGAERLASYPGTLWMLIAGVIAMAVAVRKQTISNRDDAR